MHYYQFNIGDYKSHTEHLSEMEDLAYRRLLDWYYLHESPIPLEISEVSRQIRMRSHCDCIAVVLQEYFERTDSGWTHGRADKEIAKAGEKSTKAAASAKARWEKNANALQTQSEGNATHNTLPITQDTGHNLGAKAPVGKRQVEYTPEFEEAWAEYPTRPGSNKAGAFKAWNARLKAGDTTIAMVEGVKRYAAYCQAMKTEPRFIKQAVTFFGPDRHFDSDWTVLQSKPVQQGQSFRERDAQAAANRVAAFAPGVAARGTTIDVTTSIIAPLEISQ